uniref:Acid sensing ion channel 4, pituitary, putative n=1 Tax=Schistosoma mansoni TaxID=6183 RepID=A0A5K4EVP9_SCHMA
MKLNKKTTEITTNNHCSQNYDLTCEFHLNPGNHQSHLNLMNSSMSDSVDKSVFNPICSDSYLYDTTMNQLLTLKSATNKKPHTNTSNCSKTSFISKNHNPFNTIGYETGQVNTNHGYHPEIIKSNSKTLPLCKLQNETIPYMRTVPHFIYISNPSNNNNTNMDSNNQMTELKTFSSTKNIPSIQPVNYEQVINRNCERIIENNKYNCPNICIHSSSTSLCECKRGDSDFDFSNILFNNPTDYYPIHKIHNHQQSTHVQTEQHQQHQQYELGKFITHENRDEKCNSMASCMINYESGENLPRSKINLSKYFKCCHRLTMLLICLLIFTCLCYRIIDYFNRYEMMKSLFVYNKFHLSKRSTYKNNNDHENNKLLSMIPEEEHNISNWFTITLCNLNPIRGSALFTIQNGSKIYDNIIKIRQNEIDFNGITKKVNDNNGLISKALLKRTGHKLNEMLKFCYIGNEKCSHRNFTSVLTIYGQCYRMKLKPSVHEVRIVLDSQDYDYIIPHKGLIGFHLWIHPNEQKASYILDLKDDKDNLWKNTQNENAVDFNSLQQSNVIQSNEITVSTEFQTLIRVALDMNVHYKQTNMKNRLCSTSTGFKECEQNANQNSPTDLSEDTISFSDKYNHNVWNARIVSATQSSKATIMYSLLALRNPNLFIRNKIDLERGLRIQQRAFIQLTNETAFNELRNLVPNYDDLRNQLISIKQLLHEIEIGIWRDQREALQMTPTDSVCSKMVIGYFETLINIIQSFKDELCKLSSVDVFYTTGFFNCLNHSQPMYDYHSQLNMNNTYQFPSYNRLASLRFQAHPRTNNHTSIMHDPVNHIDMNYYENMQNPSLIELQIIQLFFTNITYNSKLKDVLRKYLKLLSAKRMQMATRTSNTRYGLSLTSHSSQSSSSTSSTNSLTSIPSSSIVLSSSPTSTSSSPLTLLSSSSGSTITSHSLQPPDRTINQNSLNNAETNQPLCISHVQIHIDSIYKVKLEKLGEAIATCLQRLELFQTSMNWIIKWNKQILKTFSIDYEHLQKVDEKNLVAFTVQFEIIGNDISMTQLTPMDKLFNPFGEIMGICFGTLSLLIPLYLIVDYFFTMKCKSSIDRQAVI